MSTKMSLHAALGDYAGGLYSLAWKMLLILVVIFVLLEIVQRLRLLEKSLRGLNKVTRFMGFSEQAGLPLLAGIVFGIVFGGGVIAGSVAEQKLVPKQVFLVSIFLAMCHGIIEDTGLMIVLGANVFWITVPRLILGVAVTWLVNRFYQPAKTPSAT
jgi:hypothetical protein